MCLADWCDHFFSLMVFFILTLEAAEQSERTNQETNISFDRCIEYDYCGLDVIFHG